MDNKDLRFIIQGPSFERHDLGQWTGVIDSQTCDLLEKLHSHCSIHKEKLAIENCISIKGMDGNVAKLQFKSSDITVVFPVPCTHEAIPTPLSTTITHSLFAPCKRIHPLACEGRCRRSRSIRMNFPVVDTKDICMTVSIEGNWDNVSLNTHFQIIVTSGTSSSRYECHMTEPTMTCLMPYINGNCELNILFTGPTITCATALISKIYTTFHVAI